ncbi:hypothetical protein [Alkalibacterium pelagium]|uniref:Uncharacterized protein n=1 Tax=Alkalibacterium pelagium TaxID=426702 RepID=A0A1H7LES5_9LACT|nr:hypothetical protein [Alkalibacterium pelagium]GEN50903.1 hypothetical protein APE02nite_15680 [Alkalibacterium pelagium]SEK97340.1 hypothetical protein SAMN04488099_10960 [Alkalibacterium pelagium]
MSNLEDFEQKASTEEHRMFEEYFSMERQFSYEDYKKNEENRKKIIDIAIEFSTFINKNYESKFFVLHQYSDFEANLESILPFVKDSITKERLIEIVDEYQENNDFPLFITSLQKGTGVVFVNLTEVLNEICSIVDYIKEN